MTNPVLPSDALDLLALWYGAWEDGNIPSKGFVDPLSLRRWVNDLSVVQVHDGEKRFFVSLHGANVARHLGPGFNKHYLEDAIPADLHDEALEPYRRALATGMPHYSVQRRTLGERMSKGLDRLILPCSTDEPGVPGQFLVWVSPIEADLLNSVSVYEPFGDLETDPLAAEEVRMRAELFPLPRVAAPAVSLHG